MNNKNKRINPKKSVIMVGIYITAAILLLLNIVIIAIHLRLAKCLPPMDDDANYYDENGNHIYYDRKLIAQLEKEKQQQSG